MLELKFAQINKRWVLIGSEGLENFQKIISVADIYQEPKSKPLGSPLRNRYSRVPNTKDGRVSIFGIFSQPLVWVLRNHSFQGVGSQGVWFPISVQIISKYPFLRLLSPYIAVFVGFFYYFQFSEFRRYLLQCGSLWPPHRWE